MTAKQQMMWRAVPEAMYDFTILPERLSEMLNVAGVLFMVALAAFLYIVMVILINVLKLKNKIDRKNDDFLLCDIAYFYEKGRRDEQEDSILISPMSDYLDHGVAVAVSDGMGGLAYGEVISRYVTDRLRELHPIDFDDNVKNAEIIRKISDEAYENYHLGSGATLVMVQIKDNFMNFYSVGDSNIILIRGGRATVLNPKQNYIFLLIRKMAEGGMSTHDAYINNRARALVDFIGNVNCRVLHTDSPIRLYEDDIILVCSDGVTDTVSASKLCKQVSSQYSAASSAQRLKLAIKSKKNPKQDNYTGVLIRMERSFL